MNDFFKKEGDQETDGRADATKNNGFLDIHPGNAGKNADQRAGDGAHFQ